MNVHTTELARQQAAYKAIKNKLWNSGPREPAPKKEIKTIAISVTAFPLWQIVDLNFDWHVKCYHDVVRQCLQRLAEDGQQTPEAVSVPIPVIVPRKPAREIIAEVLENYPGITWRDLKAQRRTRNIVLPRQIAMYQVSMQREDMSLPAIGRLFGGRDHTTVLHAVRKISKMLADGRLKLARHESLDGFED